jgi:hypothetical protein
VSESENFKKFWKPLTNANVCNVGAMHKECAIEHLTNNWTALSLHNRYRVKSRSIEAPAQTEMECDPPLFDRKNHLRQCLSFLCCRGQERCRRTQPCEHAMQSALWEARRQATLESGATQLTGRQDEVKSPARQRRSVKVQRFRAEVQGRGAGQRCRAEVQGRGAG